MKLLDTKDVAALLKKPESWVRVAARKGVLPAIRVGQHFRFDADELDHWLQSQRVVMVPPVQPPKTQPK